LKDLGVNSLWLTPILAHTGSYHGYCTTDFSTVDTGFGTNDKFRQLVAAAHARNMFVILDIVVNHMCDLQTTYAVQPNHYSCANQQDFKNLNGLETVDQEGQELHGPKGILKFSQRFFPPLKNQNFFNRCGTNSHEDMQGIGPAAVYGDFVAGMFDFDTRNKDFQQIFTDLHKFWIAYADVDGFRMDAVKHVSEDFIAYFNTQIRDYARSIGKLNFFIIGEVAGPSDWIGRRLGRMGQFAQNPPLRGTYPVSLAKRIAEMKPIFERNPIAPYPGLNAAYDFAHGGTAVDVLQNIRPTSALEDHFRSEYYANIANNGDPRLSWNLLEIHDWPRFASRNPGAMAKSILGIGYLAFAEGSPVIYYGLEQGFNGQCPHGAQCPGFTDAFFRQDMFVGGMTRLGSTVPEINALGAISYGNPNVRFRVDQDPYLNRNHELYRLARKFLHIRSSCEALRVGGTAFRWSESGNEGISIFFRPHPTHPAEHVLIVMNTGWQSRQIPEIAAINGAMNGTWRNLLNAGEAAQVGGGRVRFNGLTIKPNSIMALVAEPNLGPFVPYLQTNLCK